MTFKGELKSCFKTADHNFIITVATKSTNISEDDINAFKAANNGLKIDISKWREKRSLDSNSYLWVLLDQIADKLNSTKEEIYRQFIKRVGVFEVLPIKDVALDRFVKSWQSKGLGWVCETLGKSKISDYTNIVAYFGTSTYDSKEMTRLLDEVVKEAKELGIPTLDDLELKKLIDVWGKDL